MDGCYTNVMLTGLHDNANGGICYWDCNHHGFDVEQKSGKRIYDDSKIESHSAITPTEKMADPESMEGKKGLVYLTVLNRFLAVFCSEECIIDKTTVTITASGIEEFKISGSVVRNYGFLKYENVKRESEFPKFEKGEIVKHSANAEERETKPPAFGLRKMQKRNS